MVWFYRCTIRLGVDSAAALDGLPEYATGPRRDKGEDVHRGSDDLVASTSSATRPWNEKGPPERALREAGVTGLEPAASGLLLRGACIGTDRASADDRTARLSE